MTNKMALVETPLSLPMAHNYSAPTWTTFGRYNSVNRLRRPDSSDRTTADLALQSLAAEITRQLSTSPHWRVFIPERTRRTRFTYLFPWKRKKTELLEKPVVTNAQTRWASQVLRAERAPLQPPKNEKCTFCRHTRPATCRSSTPTVQRRFVLHRK